MRFRTELLPVLPIVLATVTTPTLLTTGCKKQDKTEVDAGKGPIVIRRNEDIPVMLGGAAVALPPPVPNPSSSSPKPKAPSPGAAAPAQGQGAAAAAAAPAAAEPRAAAAQPSTTSGTSASFPNPPAITIAHNHPPDQPCHPLSKEEVEKALADLQKRPP